MVFSSFSATSVSRSWVLSMNMPSSPSAKRSRRVVPPAFSYALRDEADTAVGGISFILGQRAADAVRVRAHPCGACFPELLLPLAVVGDRERHEHLERHLVLAVGLQEAGPHAAEVQGFEDDGFRGAAQ